MTIAIWTKPFVDDAVTVLIRPILHNHSTRSVATHNAVAALQRRIAPLAAIFAPVREIPVEVMPAWQTPNEAATALLAARFGVRVKALNAAGATMSNVGLEVVDLVGFTVAVVVNAIALLRSPFVGGSGAIVAVKAQTVVTIAVAVTIGISAG